MSLKEKIAKRKEEKRNRDPYDAEEFRLLLKMQTMDQCTPEYKEAQEELKVINQSRAESRESKRRISKETKGGIILKLLGLAGAGVGLFSIIKAERDGLTFTGEKRSIMDAISRGIGQIFVRQ